MTGRGVAAGLAVAVLGAAIAAGLVLVGPPSEARAIRLDERRVGDLTQLSRDVKLYWSREHALPGSLDELAGEGGLGLRRTDPESGAPYEYRLVDATHYELCAEFATETSVPAASRREQFWAHGRGRRCFTVEVEDRRSNDRERR